jgi:hypothetical protein
LAFATLAAAFAQLVAVTEARAQSGTDQPFRPALTDPLHAQRFGGAPDRGTRASATAPAPPSSAGETGSDSTGAVGKKKKIVKRKPGEPRPPPPAPLPPPGPPQRVEGHGSAPQLAARTSYAEAYRPPDALPRRSPIPPQDAFDPIGLRVGTFVVKPSVEVTRGYDTNPSHLPGGKSSAFTVVEPALQARSDWSRHEFTANLRGSYANYDTLTSANRPLVDAKANARIDVSRDTKVNLESRFFLSTDYPGSPNLPADIAKLPVFTTVGQSAGATQRFSRLELTARGNFDRTAYRDSELTDGTMSSNHDRDFNQYGAQVRAGYELTPGIRPFVDLSGDMRQHDLNADRNGLQRDSHSFTPRVGTSFELTRILTGEISVGYLTRHYQDPTLQDLKGVLFDASLVWAATGLTTATLTASSRGEEVVVAGVSGALRRDVGLQIDHAFRRWLIGTLKVGYGYDQYVGNGRNDTRTSLGAAITYKMNRDLWLKGEYRYDRLRSNAANVDNDASVFLIGLKLQR